MKTVAVIGASGFIGLRLAEILQARSEFILRPLVRAPSSLAVLARQRSEWRICDFLSAASLAAGLKGADYCIHAAMGDPAQIPKMAGAAYRACAAAGVRKLVWLSSASVHGQNPAPGTDETTPLHDRHALIYNNAKVRAEWTLENLSKDGRVEVIRIRPAVVYGPRSRWIADAILALGQRKAGWISGGRGVCNAIYVDNLIDAILAALHTAEPAGHAFLVNDREFLTWRDFLLPIARHLRIGGDAFLDLAAPQIVRERESMLAKILLSRPYALLATKITWRAKRIVKAVAEAWPTPVIQNSTWKLREHSSAELTPEMALLQQTPWRLPLRKAQTMLGYSPQISFEDGLSRSLSWHDACAV